MRSILHVRGKFAFSGDMFGDPRLSLFVDPYDSVAVVDIQCMAMM